MTALLIDNQVFDKGACYLRLQRWASFLVFLFPRASCNEIDIHMWRKGGYKIRLHSIFPFFFLYLNKIVLIYFFFLYIYLHPDLGQKARPLIWS